MTATELYLNAMMIANIKHDNANTANIMVIDGKLKYCGSITSSTTTTTKFNIMSNRLTNYYSYCSSSSSTTLSSKEIISNILTKLNKDERVKSKEEVKRLKQYEQDLEMNESLLDFHLATFYSQGLSNYLQQDEVKAMELFKKAADKDLAEGQYAIAMNYLTGSISNLFRPIFPSIINYDDATSTTTNNESVIIGDGWVSNGKQQQEGEFDFKQWLKAEKKRVLFDKENHFKLQQQQMEKKKEGLRWLTLSAIQEYAYSQFTLGMILLNGKFEMTKNEEQGIYWLKKSAENGDINAMHELGKYYFQHAEMSLIEQLAEKAQDDEVEIKVNKELMDQAIEYFGEASKMGNCESSYRIGSIYISGPTEETLLKGISYMELATSQGSGEAAFLLTMLYRNGLVPQEYRPQDIDNIDTTLLDSHHQLSHHYLNIAIGLNDPTALLLLGELYFNGNDPNYPTVNYKKALHYFSESARLGNSDACVNQGVMHFNGFGTPVDYQAAFYCYQSAFENNPKNEAAIRNLHTMHRDGLGVPKSQELATLYSNLLIKLKNQSETN
ncbi:hypothetical protein DFA_04563 [Cavenderia fasciculata]|uniref:Uncharacterized protein n=1 Tax=Cavenderia fasciculata TaxID=261658 RepID=F4PPX8_CACFS|nr:uncharacterized protein DFA_04563 [Cavenderia fasciculata]EGG22441.1 hypothetical protein DFA_04563 [Cavenderia fasciculata]|eukprot:XP_004360292.1 hypothetical protein DFA_04563 [Cavenderia fasciculata]